MLDMVGPRTGSLAREKQPMASKLDFESSTFSNYCTETYVVNYLVVEVTLFKIDI